MAVAMDTPCYENESIVRVNDDQNFEVVTFSDSSLNSFDVGETRLGLHHSSSVDHGTGC